MKIIVGYLIAAFFVVVSIAGVYSQNCPNADFSQNNFSSWAGRYGSVTTNINPFATTPTYNLNLTGFSPGRHTIVTGAGTDPYTGGLLPVVPPGFTHALKLGNDMGGSQAEGVTYNMLVDPTNALFVYSFAIVLENPSGHPAGAQPSFSIIVKDANGNTIPCTDFVVTPISGFPANWQNGTTTNTRWLDWSKVGVDLSPYIGQNVSIEVKGSDCSYGAHFGYSYFTARCQPLEIEVNYCVGDTIAILTAPDGFQSYLWNTGATTQSIVVSNPAGSTQLNYDVTITSFTGCSANLTTVVKPTVIHAGFDTLNLCQNEVAFLDTSLIENGTLGGWKWYFGDGDSSEVQNPVHNYALPGPYDITLIAISTLGCSDTIVKTYDVIPKPDANFVQQTICGLAIPFIDSSTLVNGNIVHWEWDFGDNNTIDSIQNPTHTYSAPGSYDVTLIVHGNNDCKDTIQKTIITNVKPVPDFNATTVCFEDSTAFTDLSTIPIGTISDWRWFFGDGNTSTNQNPNYQYGSYGTYDVMLIANTPANCPDTIVKQITVHPLPELDFSAQSVCLGEATQFTNLSSIPIGTIDSYEWNFDDGINTSTDINPLNTYVNWDEYIVRLVGVSNEGCRDTIYQRVEVYPVPQVDFMSDLLDGCMPLSLNFINNSSIDTGSIATYSWNFGDDNTSDNTNPSHIYPNNGVYTITLTAISDRGCDSTLVKPKYITVHPRPVANFQYTPDYITVNDPFVRFTDLSINPETWEWNFGDGSPHDFVTNPSHLYSSDTGTYTVTLIVNNRFNCDDSIAYQLVINPDYTIYIPNSFTPNDDGINESFKVYGRGLKMLLCLSMTGGGKK